MTRSGALLLVALAAAAFTAIWWLSRTPAVPHQPAAPPPAVADDAAAAPLPAVATAPARGDAPDATATERTPERTLAPTTAASRTPQGLRGLVLDRDARPLAGVEVHLLESAGNDPLAVAMMLQQRLPASPVASSETALDGTFAIGLPRVQPRTYELYLSSPRHATLRIGELRLLDGEWHDLGALTMVPGTTLRGRVTVEGTGTPVPNAVVLVEPGTAFDDLHRRSLPDGHRGLVATADATGRYELQHAPAQGSVRMAAVAPGFARVVRLDVELGPETVEVDFALPRGFTLRGVVQDGDGRPLDQARVEAWPADAAAGPTVTSSDHAGTFALEGLGDGPHRVRVTARGFHGFEQADVAPGRGELVVVLLRRGSVAVRATTANGAVLRTYRLDVRRWFDDGGGQIGFVADVPEQSVRLDGMTERAVLTGLPVGTFVCEVAADGFAKSWSAPFSIAAEPAPVPLEIDVLVSRGATLRGRAELDDGSPLAGAAVRTLPVGADPESPFWKLVAGSVPTRISEANATTAADGTFALPHLTAGDYQLEVRHPDACRTVSGPIRVEAERDVAAPPLRLARGAVVTGRATVGGRVAGQIKVVLMEAGAGRAGLTTRLETVTDARGVYRLPRRVPPGTYELRAAVVGEAEPDAQILRQLLQLQRSSTTVSIPPGVDEVERDIDIPAPR